LTLQDSLIYRVSMFRFREVTLFTVDMSVLNLLTQTRDVI